VIKFIIIEDELKIQATIKEVIRKVLKDKEIKTSIENYKQYDEALKRAIKDKDVRKIYIMDIELKGEENGIQIAKKIRANDWQSEIIFITNHDKMFETVYRNVLVVFDFIEKFHNMEKRLEKDINIIVTKNFDNKLFRYKARNVDIQIFLKAINYIVRDKEERKVIIHTDANDYKINMNLNEIYELLDSRFVYTHRSCIANKDNIEECSWSKNHFILVNGERVDYLSRKYKEGMDM